MNMQRAAGLGLAVSLLASAALAQAPATKQAKDATGASFSLAGQSDAAGAFHYRDVMEGLTPTGVPTAWYVDALNLGHVSVDASVLPAGAAKDSSVTQLDSDLKAAFAAGMAVTGPLTAAQLATAGLATSAAQGDQTGSGALALGTANAAATIPLSAGRGTVGTNISGLTGTGAVLIPEAQNGPGAPWVTANVIAPGAVAVQSITTDGNYSFDGGGHYAVRLRVGTAAGTASSATVAYDATTSSGIVRETNSAAILAAAQATQANTANNATSTLQTAGNVSLSTIVTNTTPSGLGVTQLVPTTGTTAAPVAIGAPPTGARYVRIYPETAAGASVSVAWTRATSAAAATSQFAAGAYMTVSLSTTGPNWDENISLSAGMNLYVGVVSGAATFDYQ